MDGNTKAGPKAGTDGTGSCGNPEVGARPHAHDLAECDERLRFESLLVDQLARFINLPADRVDAEIGNAQRQVCECLGLDLSALWQWEDGAPGTLVLTHYYRRFDGPPVPERMESTDYFPWTHRQLVAGRSIIFDSLDALPADAESDASVWRHFGIKDVLVFPLAAEGGSTFGTVSFHDVAAARTWSPDLVKRLALVARIFANALLRKRNDQVLRESEERLAMATDAADAGTWSLDAREGRFWVSAKVLELFGIPPCDGLDMDRFLELVHPQDRQAVSHAMEEAIESREMRVVEYRLVQPDGRVRWMQSRGRLLGFAESARLMGITSDISERKTAEAAFEQINRQSKIILSSLAEGVLGVDMQGNHTFVNPSAARMLGYGPEELEGRNAHQMWHHSREEGTSYPEAECPICATRRNGVEQRVAGDLFWRKDGTCFPVDFKSLPLWEEERRVGAVITFEDISKRLASEKFLRESAARMAAAMDIAELGYYEVLNGVRVSFADNRANEIIGIPPADAAAGRMLEFWMQNLCPEDFDRVMEVRRAMEDEGLDRLTVDYRFLHPDRGVVHLLHLAHVMERDAAGRAVRTIGVLQDVTERKRNEESLRQALDEVRQLRDRLQHENVYLREQIRVEAGHGEIVGDSEPVQKMLRLARKVAPTDSAVLITGETGTGKELLAQAIHDQSARKGKTMVKVNCAALPAPLIESELFGREKGAYTGAMTQQLGRFELADGSTIFLDEIGDLPLDLQSKLLRVLQDGRFERLGGTRTVQTDVRVIAATNRDLGAMVKAGTFREDLFHRLNVFPIEAPPLRARVSDIPTLTWTFVQELNAKMGRTIEAIPKATMEALKRYPWSGNVRELRNVIERAMIVSDGRSLAVELPETAKADAAGLSTLEDVERKHIRDVLERTRWRISGKGGAAEVLGLIPTTLHSRMKKLGIARPGQ